MSSVIVQKVWNLYERSMDESGKYNQGNIFVIGTFYRVIITSQTSTDIMSMKLFELLMTVLLCSMKGWG